MEDYGNTKKLLVSQSDDEKLQYLRSRFDIIMKGVKIPET